MTKFKSVNFERKLFAIGVVMLMLTVGCIVALYQSEDSQAATADITTSGQISYNNMSKIDNANSIGAFDMGGAYIQAGSTSGNGAVMDYQQRLVDGYYISINDIITNVGGDGKSIKITLPDVVQYTMTGQMQSVGLGTTTFYGNATIIAYLQPITLSYATSVLSASDKPDYAGSYMIHPSNGVNTLRLYQTQASEQTWTSNSTTYTNKYSTPVVNIIREVLIDGSGTLSYVTDSGTYTIGDYSNTYLTLWTNTGVTAIDYEITESVQVEEYTLNLYRGGTYSWKPTTSVETTITVTGNETGISMNDYSSSNGYASVENGTISVSIPTSYDGTKYYVSIKAESSNPTQIAYYNITFNIYTKVTINADETFYEAVGGAYDVLKAALTTVENYTISSSNTDIVNVSKNGYFEPGNNVTVGTYTVTITIQDLDISENVASITLNVVVKAQLVFTNDPASGRIN